MTFIKKVEEAIKEHRTINVNMECWDDGISFDMLPERMDEGNNQTIIYGRGSIITVSNDGEFEEDEDVYLSKHGQCEIEIYF